MHAKYIALYEASTEIVYLQRAYNFIRNILKVPDTTDIPVSIFCDNESTIKNSKNPEFHKRSKHIEVKYHYTRELVELNIITVLYIDTNDNITDIFTKPLGLAVLNHHINKILF